MAAKWNSIWLLSNKWHWDWEEINDYTMMIVSGSETSFLQFFIYLVHNSLFLGLFIITEMTYQNQ